MGRIAITGAGGTVGREVLDAFGPDDEVVAFTHSAHDDLDSQLLDVTDPGEVSAALEGFDAVVHLAGASSPSASWESALAVNVEGTKHVLEACVENDVDRVVFASSNHAVGTYNAPPDAGPEDTETLAEEYTRVVRPETPTSPDSFYGVSKAACEDLVRFYATRRGLEGVNLRIGWYLSADDLRDLVTDPSTDPARARFARAIWLSPRDCRAVHRRAATADLPENPVTVNAISRNADRFHSLTETMRLLGYEPRDDASEVLEG